MTIVVEKKLPIHFFTIVLNGMPFIEYHLKAFSELDVPWCWHIIEGVAALNHDTAWSVASGGTITGDIHKNGLSIDGTTEYLDTIQKQYPENIFIYRKKPGFFWDGKKEMVSAPLKNITEKCLLWQIDADELWTPKQINSVYVYFIRHPKKSAAYYWCWYFVGPTKFLTTRYNYAENPNQEWLRTWRYEPGDQWGAHEPPTLIRKISKNSSIDLVDVAKLDAISHQETEKIGAVFQHYAYVTPEQIEFKETYYGYKNAKRDWLELQNTTSSGLLSKYFHWVNDRTIYDDVGQYPISLIATQDASNNQWQFNYATDDIPLGKFSTNQKKFKIAVDGIFWQYLSSGISRVWTNILDNWVELGYADQIVVFDRVGTAPKIPGIHYWAINRHDYNKSVQDSIYLQELCDKFEVDFFISTYYTTPTLTPSFFMGYDMIPEVLGFPLVDQTWIDKKIAVHHAQKHGMISHNSIKDLSTVYPHLDPSKSIYLPIAVDKNIYQAEDAEIADFLTKYHLQHGKFILLVGERLGYGGYKNAGLVFEALALSQKTEFTVVCIGGQESVEDELIKINPKIKTLRIKASDEELRAAYSAAYCLVYPSKYEGFGLPPLEAMACGCPVITCKNSSLVEVVGEAAIFVDDSDPTQVIDALESLKSQTLRDELIQKGYQQVKSFSYIESAYKLFSEITSMRPARSPDSNSQNQIWDYFKRDQLDLNHKISDLLESQITLKHENNLLLSQVSYLEKANANVLVYFSTTSLIKESVKRLVKYPVRKIKRMLPNRLKTILRKIAQI